MGSGRTGARRAILAALPANRISRSLAASGLGASRRLRFGC